MIIRDSTTQSIQPWYCKSQTTKNQLIFLVLLILDFSCLHRLFFGPPLFWIFLAPKIVFAFWAIFFLETNFGFSIEFWFFCNEIIQILDFEPPDKILDFKPRDKILDFGPRDEIVVKSKTIKNSVAKKTQYPFKKFIKSKFRWPKSIKIINPKNPKTLKIRIEMYFETGIIIVKQWNVLDYCAQGASRWNNLRFWTFLSPKF